MFGLLQRSIFWDLLKVFSLSLIALTSIFVLAGVVQEASRQGLGPENIVELIPLLLPGTLPFTVPATMLFAVSVVYGRMAHDNEITAIKAAGVPIRIVIMPAFALGTLLSVIVFSLYWEFIPHAHNRLRESVFTEFETLIYARLRHQHCFQEPKVNYTMFVQDVQGRTLIQAIFKKLDDMGKVEAVAHAAEAELYFDMKNQEITVEMYNVQVSYHKTNQNYTSLRERWQLPMPKPNENRNVRARERSIPEIQTRIVEVEQSLKEKRAQLEEMKRNPPAPTASEPIPALIALQFSVDALVKELGELRVEKAMRPALCLGCLIFTLIGCPVAIWFQRRDYLSNFVTCFLPIVVINYPLLMFAIHLGKSGRLDPDYGMWIGNAILGLMGLFFLWRISRR